MLITVDSEHDAQSFLKAKGSFGYLRALILLEIFKWGLYVVLLGVSLLFGVVQNVILNRRYFNLRLSLLDDFFYTLKL